MKVHQTEQKLDWDALLTIESKPFSEFSHSSINPATQGAAHTPWFVTTLYNHLKSIVYKVLTFIGILSSPNLNPPKGPTHVAEPPKTRLTPKQASHPKETSGLAATTPPEVEADPFCARSNSEVLDKLSELYMFLSNDPWDWIPNQSTILDLKDKIVDLKPHPFTVFSLIFSDKICANALSFKKSALRLQHEWSVIATIITAVEDPWPAFLKQNARNLQKHHEDNNLLHLLQGFCEHLNFDNTIQQKLESHIKMAKTGLTDDDKTRWEQWYPFINLLFEEIEKRTTR